MTKILNYSQKVKEMKGGEWPSLSVARLHLIVIMRTNWAASPLLKENNTQTRARNKYHIKFF